MSLKLLFVFLFCTKFNYLIPKANGDECFLPEKCHLQIISSTLAVETNEKGEHKKLIIMCEINDSTFEFNFKEPIPFNAEKKCPRNNTISRIEYIIFRSTNSKELTILDKRFNLSNVIRYNRYFKYPKYAKFWGSKRI